MKHLSNLGSMAAAAVIALSLAACGGGGGGGAALPGAPSNPGTGAPTTNAGKGTAAMQITIPTKSSSSRFKYISASTQSVSVGTVSGSTVTPLATADLTPGSPGCAAVSGALQCSVSFVATAGSATFQLAMYSGKGETGNLLSKGNVQATIVAGQSTNVPMVLGGVPDKATVVLGQGSLPVGTAGTTSVMVQALDASGNVIIGPGQYATALTVAITNDKYQTLSLSNTTFNSPGQVETLSYTGGSNVGTTLTVAGATTANTSATFAGSGTVATVWQPMDTTNGFYFEPYDIAAGPNGTAASMGYLYTCCSPSVTSTIPSGQDTIALATASTQTTKFYMGDTTDVFNPPSTAPTHPGVTVVHGMSSSIEDDELYAYDDIAVNQTTGTIYYSGETTTSSDPACVGGSSSTGTIGALNPTAGTTVERILKGYPGPIKVDGSGNVWWIEYHGYCSSTGYELGSDTYAIGEMTSSGAITETPFSVAGVSYSSVSDMAVNGTGTIMYISDESDNMVTAVTLSGTPGATGSLTINSPHEAKYPYTVSVSSDDGSVFWYSDEEPEYNYFFGYVPGSKTFSLPNELEGKVDSAPYMFAYDSTYADGSFWVGADETNDGFARVSGTGTGAAQVNQYGLPYNDGDGADFYGVGAGGGYVWGADESYYRFYALQYGAPSNGTISLARRSMALSSMHLPGTPNRAAASHHVTPGWMKHVHHG